MPLNHLNRRQLSGLSKSHCNNLTTKIIWLAKFEGLCAEDLMPHGIASSFNLNLYENQTCVYLI
jgi:hypothetical protein